MSKKHRTKKRKAQAKGDGGVLTAVLVWVGVAISAALLALLIGNLLGDTADGLPSGVEKPPLYQHEGTGAPTVDAVLLDIGSKNDADIASAVSKLQDRSDVSIVLRGEDGRIRYSSEIAGAVTGTLSGASLKAATEALKDKGIYISGCFYSRISTANNENTADAIASYESALILEAAEAGVDDILVLGMPTDETGIAYASALFKKVRDKSPELKLGAAIDYKSFEDGRAAYLIETYSRIADFCSIDTRAAFSETTNAAAIVSKNLFYFEKYPIRVLISELGSADRMAQVKALNELGIYNIQSAGIYSAAG